MIQNEFIEVAKVDEIPSGKMKNVEVNGKEMVIANLDGKFYALSDKCSHMNAPLSMGNLKENVVTCPLHAAKFDVTTGKKVAEPKLIAPTEPLPQTWQKFMERAGQFISHIKTYDQDSYEIKVEENSIRIKA
jgi:nitrite reductase/ring-hydroxylating ferredoxin subunit